jgi:NADPH:quinone reductase
MEFGGPEALQVLDLPRPEPGPHEVRMRVRAAAVNPSDLLFRSGRGQALLLGDRQPPFVPGMDAAGVIDKLGPDPDGRLAVGDPVVALVLPAGRHGGAYAEQIVVPAASVVHAPKNVDFPAASTLLLNAFTARLALDALDLAADQIVAITGAAGALGGYAIQLARADGLRVIADASQADEALIRSLGADIVVARGDDVPAAIRAVVPNGVDGLIDGAAQVHLALPAIRDGGGLAVIRGWDGPTERGIVLHKISSLAAATDTARLDSLREQVEDATLTLRVADILPADQAAAAHRRLAAGGVRGRLVLDFTS